MNLPNLLTVLRVLLTLVFFFFLTQHGLVSVLLASGVFALAAWTDFYDGYYAKKHNLVSDFGKIMDPIADKFLILTAFFVFTCMHIMAEWMFMIIMVREVFVTGSRLLAVRRGKVIAAEGAGKLKTVFQILAIMVILSFLLLQEAGWVGPWSTHVHDGWFYGITVLLWVAVGLTLFSGVSYLWNNRRSLRSTVL